MKKLYAGQIPVDDLVLSKKLSQKPEDYKTTAPHVELAKDSMENTRQVNE